MEGGTLVSMSHAPDEASGPKERASGAVEFTPAESEVISFLRNSKRVDLRWLSEQEKTKIRDVLDGLHNGKMVSLSRISNEVGRSYTAIWGLCRALEIHTRTVAEGNKESAGFRSKHKRTAFDGTEEDRAYMLGFKNGDLTAWQVSGTAVMVTSTTTHPAFAELFRELFERYGHVYEYPMYEEGNGYKWKLAVRLDNSFRFLIKTPEASLDEMAGDRSVFLSWLAGLVDSDGHVRAAKNGVSARAIVAIYRINRSFLVSLQLVAERFGYHFDGPYLTAEKGDTTPKGITYRSDFWNIAIQRSSQTQALLRELPLRHREKVERKALALSINPATQWSELGPKVLKLKLAIQAEVDMYVQKAVGAHAEKRRVKEPSMKAENSSRT